MGLCKVSVWNISEALQLRAVYSQIPADGK